MSKKRTSFFRRTNTKKVLIYGIIFLAIVVSLSYIISNKFSNKNNVVVSAANVPKKVEIKTNSNEKPKIENQENVKTTSNNLVQKNENISNAKETKNDNPPQNNVQASFINPFNKDGKKAAYLTFDDGPSANTPLILDTLKKYNIKATFFVIGKMANENKEMLKREKAEGHSIGNHTYSHDYKYIYADPKNFLDDLNKNNEIIASILDGYTTKIIRFPGGSFGDKRAPYREAVEKAGYHYVDWNALNGDAEATLVPVDKLLVRLKTTVGNQEHVVVLMHDAPGKTTTIQALPQIIEYLKSLGYEFRTL